MFVPGALVVLERDSLKTRGFPPSTPCHFPYSHWPVVVNEGDRRQAGRGPWEAERECAVERRPGQRSEF